MKSMTGFGKGQADFSGGMFSIEISSVNRKQLEVRLSLGSEFSAWEMETRSVVSKVISRGAVSVRVNFMPSGSEAGMQINEALLNHLIKEADRLQKAFPGNGGKFELSNLFLVPGVVERVSPDTDEKEPREAFFRALNSALDNFDAMRRVEGEALRKDISGRLKNLRDAVEKIRPLAGKSAGEQKKRLLEKLNSAGLMTSGDDERLLKEVVIYLDKADFTEELTRLDSHFLQFEKFLVLDTPTGRSMDFLVQEMFREINTLGNKAGDAEISKQVVFFKTELEKIREQIQNIE